MQQEPPSPSDLPASRPPAAPPSWGAPPPAPGGPPPQQQWGAQPPQQQWGGPPPAKSKRSLVTALVMIAVLAIAAVGAAALLGGGDEDENNDDPVAVATTVATTDDTTEDTTEGTTEDAIDIRAGDIPAGAETYTDEDGEYSMAVNPAWTQSEFSGLPVWYTGAGTSDFGDNVNILTENYDGDLGDYLDLSVENAPTQIENFELVSSDIETGAFGQEIGVMVFNGVAGAVDMPLTFYATVVVGNGNAVVATFTAPQSQFDTDVQDVISYMATLQPE